MQITVWNSESPAALMERLEWCLMEMGVKVRAVSVYDDHVVYEMEPAELLPENDG